MLLQRCCDGQMDPQLILTSLVQIGCQKIHDLLHVLIVQLVEHDNIINTVDKFRLEAALYFFHDIGFHLLVILCLALLCGKAQILGIHDTLCTRIGSHDQHSVLEADLASLGVRDMTVIQYLQKYIKYIRMRFLDLVKQNNRVGITANLLAQLSAFFKAYISRR